MGHRSLCKIHQPLVDNQRAMNRNSDGTFVSAARTITAGGRTRAAQIKARVVHEREYRS